MRSEFLEVTCVLNTINQFCNPMKHLNFFLRGLAGKEDRFTCVAHWLIVVCFLAAVGLLTIGIMYA